MTDIKIAASDIESNNWIDFLMIGLYDERGYKLFADLNQYLDYVLTEKFNGYKIFFHNGGKFDFLFIFEKLLERGEVQIISKSSGLLALIYKFKKIKIEFRDSYALLPASLDKLIKTYNIPEIKIKIDFTKKHKFSDKNLQLHLKHDCISLYKILNKFLEHEGFLSMTVASHALKVFEKKFFHGDFWNVNDNFDNYFRFNYYKGGRVEVYKGYGKNLYYYDINSLYPLVMLEKMPAGFPLRTKKYMLNKIGFYKIELLQKYESHISILVKKTKKGNYYVNGKKGDIFYLISCEIEELKNLKIKFKVLDGYYFTDKEYLFNDYVNHYYKIKQETKDEVERYISKLMLNSLYGKMGQKLYGQSIEVDKGQGDFPVYDEVNGLLLVDKKRHIKFKGVYIASYITALARMKHYNLMKSIGFEHIYYCDTDSIITDKQIKIGTKIGDVKLVDKIKEGIFLLPKTYGYKTFDSKEYIHFKGFKNEYFSYNDLKDLLINKKDKLEQTMIRVLGFKESIKRKNDIYRDKGTYLKTAQQTKVLTFNYTRRKVIADKKHHFITECFDVKEIT
jgi:hypothetical protein